jgi:hypothetical protein
MNYITKQLTLENVSQKYFNMMVATGIPSSDSKFVEFEYGVSYDELHLRYQSRVFANEIITRSAFNFIAILGERDFSQQVRILEELYVYSYYKSFFFGTNVSSSQFIPKRSYVFVGHGIFQRILSRSRFTLERDDFSLYLHISVAPEEREAILNKLIKSYPFLDSAMTLNANGQYEVHSPYYESCFQRLLDASNYVSDKRIYNVKPVPVVNGIVSSSNNILNDQSSSDEVSELHTSKPESEGRQGNSSSLKKGMRIIEIFDLADTTLDEFVLDTNLVLGNSVISASDVNLWYYIFDPRHTIKNSIDYHLCRALFFHLRKVNTSNPGSTEQFYTELERNHIKDFLIPKDVRSITYLNVNRGISSDLGENYTPSRKANQLSNKNNISKLPLNQDSSDSEDKNSKDGDLKDLK